jgi:two-component system, OmpR family, sensor histidine kinase ArlS
MYSIYDVQRRNAIDTDLNEYTDFLISGLSDEPYNLSDLFSKLLEKKDKPSKKPKSHRFFLASNDSLIFEENALVNIDSLVNVFLEKADSKSKSAYHTLTLEDLEYRIYTRNIEAPKGKGYQLVVITSLDRLYESLAQLRYILFIICPISLIIAAIIGLFIARRALAPVTKITKTAAMITSQNLEERVPISKSDDELSTLARTFNDMISRLDLTFKSQQRFIADASHDFRTPLTSIQMELELLNNRDDIQDNTRATIDRCLKEISRLSGLADNLLILARADAHQLIINKKPVRLDEIIMDCLSQLNNLAKVKNVNVRLNMTHPIELSADEAMLKRAFINVLDNSIKFSPSNDIVTITLEKNEKSSIIKINNNGYPIPKELLSKIFNRFQRGDTSRTTKGFGLGLAIVKAIIEAHYGTVSIESSENHGTTLKIYLPI